mgnify:CR=1 FL=1
MDAYLKYVRPLISRVFAFLSPKEPYAEDSYRRRVQEQSGQRKGNSLYKGFLKRIDNFR